MISGSTDPQGRAMRQVHEWLASALTHSGSDVVRSRALAHLAMQPRLDPRFSPKLD